MSQRSQRLRGDLLPEMRCEPPGPRSRAFAATLARCEAPGVNTLATDHFGPVWSEAQGSNVVDADGNRYLDLTSGFGAAAVGHRHPAVVAAVQRQSATLLHGLGDVAAHEARVALGAALTARAPLPEPLVYFAVSGADAVEIALKTAILATGRSDVLAFDGGYHGLSFGALGITGIERFRAPFHAHLSSRVTHLPYGASAAAVGAALERLRPACVVVEPILGRGGIVLPPTGWLSSLAATCARYGALLVVDEILTGGGRTGTFFAVEAEGVQPDLVCCGKGLAGGLPMAAVLGRRSLMSAWPDGEALHTGTFLAHPLGCAACLAVLRVLDDEDLVARVGALGEMIAGRLSSWPHRFPSGVRGVRGRGLLWGIELSSAKLASAVIETTLRSGLLLLAGGDGRVVELLPAMTITEPQLECALELLAEALAGLDT